MTNLELIFLIHICVWIFMRILRGDLFLFIIFVLICINLGFLLVFLRRLCKSHCPTVILCGSFFDTKFLFCLWLWFLINSYCRLNKVGILASDVIFDVLMSLNLSDFLNSWVIMGPWNGLITIGISLLFMQRVNRRVLI